MEAEIAVSLKMYNPIYNYDKNGNIGYLKRTTANGATLMDELIYSYNANQLTAIADSGNVNTGFMDKSNVVDYTYDASGNMNTNNNKDLTIKYNALNLPYEITRTNGGANNSIIKHYYAGSTKVRMETYAPNGTTLLKAYDYLAGMVYVTQDTIKTLDFISTTEGRALLTSKILNVPSDSVKKDKFRYEYSLKDHLGNLRVSCRCAEPKRDSTGTIIPTGQLGAGIEPLAIVQEQHYDPWGLAFTARSLSGAEADRFTYNSKELLTELDLGWNDYGARMYMSETGRWNVVDPLAEKMRRYSSYNYAFDNPLRFIDPDGMKPNDIIINGSKEFVQKTFEALSRLTNDKLVINENTGKVTVGQKGSGDLKYGTALVRHLTSEKVNDILIIDSPDGRNRTIPKGVGDNKTGYESTVEFNTDKTTGGVNENGSFERPTEIGLGHELIHASHRNEGKLDDVKTNLVDPDTGKRGELSKEEIQTRKEENILRKEQNLSPRKLPKPE